MSTNSSYGKNRQIYIKILYICTSSYLRTVCTCFLPGMERVSYIGYPLYGRIFVNTNSSFSYGKNNQLYFIFLLRVEGYSIYSQVFNRISVIRSSYICQYLRGEHQREHHLLLREGQAEIYRIYLFLGLDRDFGLSISGMRLDIKKNQYPEWSDMSALQKM